MAARVVRTTLNSKKVRLEVSPGGMTEKKMATRTMRKPRDPQIHVPAEPPGTRMAWGLEARSDGGRDG